MLNEFYIKKGTKIKEWRISRQQLLTFANDKALQKKKGITTRHEKDYAICLVTTSAIFLSRGMEVLQARLSRKVY